eukprot:g11634.t1
MVVDLFLDNHGVMCKLDKLSEQNVRSQATVSKTTPRHNLFLSDSSEISAKFEKCDGDKSFNKMRSEAGVTNERPWLSSPCFCVDLPFPTFSP